MSTIKIFMRRFYPGIFVSDFTDIEVKSRDPNQDWGGAYSIYFYDRVFGEIDGEVVQGKEKNKSPTYYKGTEFTAEEAIRACGEDSILAENIKINGYRRLVRTTKNQWFPLQDGDIVIREAGN